MVIESTMRLLVRAEAPSITQNNSYALKVYAMSIQYVTDDQGQHVAVVVPIREWEAILDRLEDDDHLTIEEATRAEEAWQEYLDGKTQTLAQVKKALLDERED